MVTRFAARVGGLSDVPDCSTDQRPNGPETLYGGGITITGGSGGRGRDRPVVRALLDRLWAEWEDFEMVDAGRDRNGDQRYRKQYTPLGRAIRALRKEYPTPETVRALVRLDVSLGPKHKALRHHLGLHDLHFGMTDAEMDGVVYAEEEADRQQEAADIERARRAEILKAVLHVVEQPWLPSEKRLGRRLLDEDTYEGLQEELVLRGYTVTARPDFNTVLVRPAR